MNSRQQGDIGLVEAISYYTKNGYTVFLPFSEATRIDLIAEKDGRVVRIQCKTSTRKKKSSCYEVGLRTNGGNQSWNKVCKKISSDEVDEVFIWCEDGSLWVFPAEILDGRTTVTAGWTNIQYHVSGPKPPKPKRNTHNVKIDN